MRILYALITTVFISGTVSANTIELFLVHGAEIEGIAEAKKQGYNIHYYYLDGVTQIEQKLAQKATQLYQAQIDSLVKKEGLKKLSQMSDSQRAIMFQQYLTKLGIRLPSFYSLLSPQDNEVLQQALAQRYYAGKHGITANMLPAVIIDHQLMANVDDLGDVLSSSADHKSGGSL
jgi:predicted NAD/FAD-dependent oxidoreductase